MFPSVVEAKLVRASITANASTYLVTLFSFVVALFCSQFSMSIILSDDVGVSSDAKSLAINALLTIVVAMLLCGPRLQTVLVQNQAELFGRLRLMGSRRIVLFGCLFGGQMVSLILSLMISVFLQIVCGSILSESLSSVSDGNGVPLVSSGYVPGVSLAGLFVSFAICALCVVGPALWKVYSVFRERILDTGSTGSSSDGVFGFTVSGRAGLVPFALMLTFLFLSLASGRDDAGIFLIGFFITFGYAIYSWMSFVFLRWILQSASRSRFVSVSIVGAFGPRFSRLALSSLSPVFIVALVPLSIFTVSQSDASRLGGGGVGTEDIVLMFGMMISVMSAFFISCIVLSAGTHPREVLACLRLVGFSPARLYWALFAFAVSLLCALIAVLLVGVIVPVAVTALKLGISFSSAAGSVSILGSVAVIMVGSCVSVLPLFVILAVWFKRLETCIRVASVRIFSM